MSDVFLSYSRKDSDFVHRLHAGLAARNRDAWVDWEGIPLSADWWLEICAGIEAADTFVFVISPDSVESPVCNLEVAHALQHNKRLVPVVYTKPDEKQAFAALAARMLDENHQAILAGRDILAVARDNWQAIARHNWLFFPQDSDFDTSFAKLVEVIDTDLDHVRRHTRLLRRALEWQNRGKTAAFLLYGEDLREAENWLAQSGSKSPVPTELHTQYIVASRQAANIRQRNLLIGVSAALIISISLAILSFGLFQQSEDRRVLADANAQTAQANLNIALNTQSQFLADLSRQQLGEDQVLPARLLALQGLANYPDIYHQENIDALVNAYYRNGAESMFLPQLSVTGVQVNKDETRLLSWGGDNTARVWDRATGKQLLLLNHPGSVQSALWNTDETLILTASLSGSAYVWDAQTGKQVLVLRQADSAFDARWADDESRITTEMIVGSDFYNLTWDAKTGSLLDIAKRDISVKPLLAASEHFRLIGEGALFATTGIEERLIVQRNGKQVAELEVPNGGVFKVAFNHDETRLMATNLSPSSEISTAYIWHIYEDDTFTNIERFPAPGEIQAAQWNVDGTRLAAGGTDRINKGGFVRLWNTTTGETLLSMHLPESVKGLQWLKGGTQIVVWGADGIHIFDVGSLDPIDVREPYPVQYVEYSHDGQYALVAVGSVGNQGIAFDGYGLLWDVAAQRVVYRMIVPDQAITHFSFSPDERYILGWDTRWNSPKGRNNRAHLWLARTGDYLTDLPVDENLGFADVTWIEDNLLLAQTSDLDFKTPTYMAVFDSRGHEVRRFPHTSRVSHYAVTQDKKRMVVTDSTSNDAVIWDFETAQKLFTLPHKDELLSITLSADNASLLTKTTTASYVWSVATGKLLASLDYVKDAKNTINDSFWSPSGRYILTYEANSNQASLWDAATYKTILTLTFPIETPIDRIYEPAWNSDETRMALSARDTLLIWSLPDGKLLRTFADSGSLEASFSPDSRHLMLGWFRKMVLDLETGDRLAFDVPGTITAMRWLDSDKIELLTNYGVRHEYIVDAAKLIEVVRQTLPRQLSNTELQQFFLPTVAPTMTGTALPTVPPEPTSTSPMLLTLLPTKSP